MTLITLKNIYLFIYLFWLCWVFVAVWAFSLVVVHEFLIVLASSGAEHRLQDVPASVVVLLSHCRFFFVVGRGVFFIFLRVPASSF